MSHRTRALAFALISLCLASAASATTYRCVVNATIYLTDRPCAPAAPAPTLGALGPTRTLSAYREMTPGMQPAPEHHRFLSQRCAELSDAIRTAPSRGVGRAVISDLHREYSGLCSDDDQQARQRLSDERSKVREDQRFARREAERAQQEAQRTQERCVALRDALRSRRVDTDADRAAKRVAETAYNSNCLGR